MLDEVIPKNKYWLADYPNLEDGAEGSVIPEMWGHVDNITPICIDTSAHTYKIANRALISFDNIYATYEVGELSCRRTLISGVDYTEDLADAEFTLASTPYLNASTTYYFVLTGTYAINGAAYVSFAKRGAVYAGGQRFDIDGASAWTGIADDIQFQIIGKEAIDGKEKIFVNNGSTWSGWSYAARLRDAAGRTRLAQSFTTGSKSFYLTKVKLWAKKTGNPTGDVTMKILSAYNPAEVQVGVQSSRMNSDDTSDWKTGKALAEFPIRGNPSGLLVEASAAPNTVADIITDCYTNVLGGSSADLETADFAALDAVKTEILGIYLDEEMTFNEFIEKLEVGQTFKFLPTLGGKYTVKYYVAGEPAGTPHFRDEDFITFKCTRDWDAVYQTVKVKYYENPTAQVWEVEEDSSGIAYLLYKNTQTLTVETWLTEGPDAAALATTYLGLVEEPQKIIEFEIPGGYGFDMIPTQKVKITRTRGDDTGGTFNGVLFRVLKLQKNIAQGTTTITAVLDTQSY